MFMNNITIVIANSDFSEGEKLKVVIGREFNVILITQPVPVKYLVERCQAVIVGSNISGSDGLDFIKAVVSNTYIPVLIITPLERQIEATQAGPVQHADKLTRASCKATVSVCYSIR